MCESYFYDSYHIHNPSTTYYYIINSSIKKFIRRIIETSNYKLFNRLFTFNNNNNNNSSHWSYKTISIKMMSCITYNDE